VDGKDVVGWAYHKDLEQLLGDDGLGEHSIIKELGQLLGW